MRKSRELKDQRQSIVREHRRTEAKLVEQGKTPYYLKRGDIKKLELAQEFEQLQRRSGSLVDIEKLTEKRRKRKASKQRRSIPISDQ